MRAVFAVVLVALVASSASQGLDLSNLGSGLLENFKQAGLNTVQGLVEAGKNLFSDLLSKALSGFGKRDLKDHIDNLKAKLKEAVEKAKTLAGGVFSGAVDKLKALIAKFHKTVGTNADATYANQEVDEVVAEHHYMQRRVLKELFESGKQLLGGFIDKAKNVAGNLFTGVKAKLSEVVSGLLQKGTDLFVGKRAVLSISDHLKNLGSTLSTLFTPFKGIVSNLGQTLKGHFSNIVETVKGHVSVLGDKLKGHVSDLATHGSKLLEHGKNALSALGEVANDVLKQTLTNAKPHIDAVVKTLGDGAKVVAGHVAGTN